MLVNINQLIGLWDRYMSKVSIPPYSANFGHYKNCPIHGQVKKPSASPCRLCFPFKLRGERPIKQGRGDDLTLERWPFGSISSSAMKWDLGGTVPPAEEEL